MDGTKPDTDTLDFERNSVGRCPARAEVWAKAWVDLAGIRILPIVAALVE